MSGLRGHRLGRVNQNIKAADRKMTTETPTPQGSTQLHIAGDIKAWKVPDAHLDLRDN